MTDVVVNNQAHSLTHRGNRTFGAGALSYVFRRHGDFGAHTGAVELSMLVQEVEAFVDGRPAEIVREMNIKTKKRQHFCHSRKL